MVSRESKKHQQTHMKNINLSVKNFRDRIGCDICKKDTSTEGFIGYLGNVLWICSKCFKLITKK